MGKFEFYRRKIYLKISEVKYTLKQGAFASLQDFWRIQNMRSKEHAKTLDALTISNRKHRSSRFAWHWFEKIQTANFWVYLNSVNGHIKGHCKNWLSSLHFVNNLITDSSFKSTKIFLHSLNYLIIFACQRIICYDTWVFSKVDGGGYFLRTPFLISCYSHWVKNN